MPPYKQQLIGAALKKAKCPLRSLNVASNGFGSRTGSAIATGLRANVALTSLNVSDNNLGPSAARSFAQVTHQLLINMFSITL
jgi:Ran GTPase-activating protein (RanGAP) involved in mRNA processing and transport